MADWKLDLYTTVLRCRFDFDAAAAAWLAETGVSLSPVDVRRYFMSVGGVDLPPPNVAAHGDGAPYVSDVDGRDAEPPVDIDLDELLQLGEAEEEAALPGAPPAAPPSTQSELAAPRSLSLGTDVHTEDPIAAEHARVARGRARLTERANMFDRVLSALGGPTSAEHAARVAIPAPQLPPSFAAAAADSPLLQHQQRAQAGARADASGERAGIEDGHVLSDEELSLLAAVAADFHEVTGTAQHATSPTRPPLAHARAVESHASEPDAGAEAEDEAVTHASMSLQPEAVRFMRPESTDARAANALWDVLLADVQLPSAHTQPAMRTCASPSSSTRARANTPQMILRGAPTVDGMHESDAHAVGLEPGAAGSASELSEVLHFLTRTASLAAHRNSHTSGAEAENAPLGTGSSSSSSSDVPRVTASSPTRVSDFKTPASVPVLLPASHVFDYMNTAHVVRTSAAAIMSSKTPSAGGAAPASPSLTVANVPPSAASTTAVVPPSACVEALASGEPPTHAAAREFAADAAPAATPITLVFKNASAPIASSARSFTTSLAAGAPAVASSASGVVNATRTADARSAPIVSAPPVPLGTRAGTTPSSRLGCGVDSAPIRSGGRAAVMPESRALGAGAGAVVVDDDSVTESDEDADGAGGAVNLRAQRAALKRASVAPVTAPRESSDARAPSTALAVSSTATYEVTENDVDLLAFIAERHIVPTPAPNILQPARSRPQAVRVDSEVVDETGVDGGVDEEGAVEAAAVDAAPTTDATDDGNVMPAAEPLATHIDLDALDYTVAGGPRRTWVSRAFTQGGDSDDEDDKYLIPAPGASRSSAALASSAAPQPSATLADAVKAKTQVSGVGEEEEKGDDDDDDDDDDDEFSGFSSLPVRRK